MAKNGKKTGGEEEKDGEQTTAAKSDDLSRATPKTAADKLRNAYRTMTRETGKLRQAYGEKVDKAKEDQHLHRSAWAAAMKEDKMEPEELAEYMAQLEHYREVLGLNERAANATKNMEFGPGEEKKAKGPPGAGTSEGSPNVRKFPTPAGVAAT